MFADLAGRRAFVTGAGRGIGKAIVAALREQGAEVIAGDVDEGLLADVAGPTVRVDVGSSSSVEEAMDAVFEMWPALDILVNNAAIGSAPGSVSTEDSEADWDATFAVNVKGVVRCCEAVVPTMERQRYGRIVNIASVSAHGSRRSLSAYGVSKAAVLRYTVGLASQLAPANVTVNAVCPGAVWSELQREFIEQAQRADPALARLTAEEAFAQRYAPLIPLGRVQSAEEVAKAVTFLASDDAGSITGQCLHVDGGMVVRD